MAGKAAIARANGKKGGRPKGAKSPETLEREAVLKAFRERVFRKADELFDAQFSIARGTEFLFRVEKATGKGDKQRHVLVTNPEEIRAFLDGEDDGEYRYLTSAAPNNQAIEGLLNRALGKPVESVALSGEVTAKHEWVVTGPDGKPFMGIKRAERG